MQTLGFFVVEKGKNNSFKVTFNLFLLKQMAISIITTHRYPDKLEALPVNTSVLPGGR